MFIRPDLAVVLVDLARGGESDEYAPRDVVGIELAAAFVAVKV